MADFNFHQLLSNNKNSNKNANNPNNDSDNDDDRNYDKNKDPHTCCPQFSFCEISIYENFSLRNYNWVCTLCAFQSYIKTRNSNNWNKWRSRLKSLNLGHLI